MRKSVLLILLLLSMSFISDAYEKRIKFGDLNYIEVDEKGNIFVTGGISGGYGGILKLDKNGNLVKLLSDKYSEISFREDKLRAGRIRFIERGQLYGPGEYRYFSLGKGPYKYMMGLTSEVFILAENENKFNEIFEFLRKKPSVESLFNNTICPPGPIAINSKGQLCVLGVGLEKAKLPVLEKGKVEKRENGEIIYTDQFYEQRIAILDPGDGHPLSVFGKSGINEGELYYPIDIAVDSKDNIYVADRFRHKIIKFSPEGEFIKEWGKWGSGDGEFEGLHSIDIDKNTNTLYVAESANAPGSDPYAVSQYRVQKFDMEGKFLGKWGGHRITGIGLFWFAPAPIREYDLREPKSIAVAPDGNVWLIESWRPSVSKFTPEGKLLLRFGEKGDINGDPRGEIGWYSEGIAVGPDGTVYVCDNGRRIGEDIKHRIVRFDSEGKYLGEIEGD